jgi:ketosteroid isomerase-like protein
MDGHRAPPAALPAVAHPPPPVPMMTSMLARCAIVSLILCTPSMGEAQITAELDAFWAELSRTVAEGDFDGYARLYHPDAVLVSLGSQSSYPIAQALSGWQQGFVDTRAGKAEAGVTFRFTQRLHDESTAHETGMFRYSFAPADGTPTVVTVHFESLLVQKDGAWLMVMEYQKSVATEEDWQAAQ